MTNPVIINRSFLYYSGTVVIAGIALYIFSQIHYLLFHSIAEVFSIVIASAVFMISWNAKKQIDNPFLVSLGIAYLFIGILDLFHTLSYVGMNIFTDYDYYANQLWIGARYLESLSLLAFFVLTGSKIRFSYVSVFILFGFITVTILLSVFYWKVFPICFIEGQGLTPFKKVSEYIISGILVLSLIFLKRNQDQFDSHIRNLLMWGILLTILGELAFTFYISNYGFSNLVGHYLKIGSFYMIYKAIIETGLSKPLDLLFRELKQNEDQLERINSNLISEIEERKRAEEKIKTSFLELQQAHENIKQLKGLLPICASCKKIRDDKGYWNNIESYIETHSEALFSHSVCPTCAEELYGSSDWYQKIKKEGKI